MLIADTVIGTLIRLWRFMHKDAKLIAKGNMRRALWCSLHLPKVGIVIFVVLTFGNIPLRIVFLTSYFLMALLKIGNLLKHHAH